jgi:hypothetical protein
MVQGGELHRAPGHLQRRPDTGGVVASVWRHCSGGRVAAAGAGPGVAVANRVEHQPIQRRRHQPGRVARSTSNAEPHRRVPPVRPGPPVAHAPVQQHQSGTRRAGHDDGALQVATLSRPLVARQRRGRAPGAVHRRTILRGRGDDRSWRRGAYGHSEGERGGGAGAAPAGGGGEGGSRRGARAGEAARGAGGAGAGEREADAAAGAGGAEPRPCAPRARRAPGQRHAAPDHLPQLSPQVPPREAAEVFCGYVLTKGGGAEVDEPLDAADGMMRGRQDRHQADGRSLAR